MSDAVEQIPVPSAPAAEEASPRPRRPARRRRRARRPAPAEPVARAQVAAEALAELEPAADQVENQADAVEPPEPPPAPPAGPTPDELNELAAPVLRAALSGVALALRSVAPRGAAGLAARVPSVVAQLVATGSARTLTGWLGGWLAPVAIVAMLAEPFVAEALAPEVGGDAP